MKMLQTVIRSWLILLCCSVAFTAEPDTNLYIREILQDKPLAFYRFSESDAQRGSPVRNEVSTKDAAIQGVYANALKLIDGPRGVGRAVEFDGSAYVEIPHHDLFNADEMSIEFWFCTKQVWDKKYWPGSATMISKFTYGWASSDLGILGGSLTAGANEGRILVGAGPKGGGDVVLASGTGLNDGRFHHVVWTRSRAGKNVLVVDGVTCATAQDNAGKISNARMIHLGGEKLETNGTFLHGSRCHAQ